MIRKVVMGTRGSILARIQADSVKDKILKKVKNIEICTRIIKTSGDIYKSINLKAEGGKGFFTKELDQALIEKEIDFAVHSIKDLPVDMENGLYLIAVPPRESRWDVLVAAKGLNLSSIPSKSIIGTSSIRRKAQILRYRDDLIVKNIRGNIETRIRKLKNKVYDGIIVAEAAINRLGKKIDLSEFERQRLNFLYPAVGQGALAVVCRENYEEVRELLKCVDDKVSRIEVEVERDFLRNLGGGCQIAAGIKIFWSKGYKTIFAQGAVFSEDGKIMIKEELLVEKNEYFYLGRELAYKILESKKESKYD